MTDVDLDAQLKYKVSQIIRKVKEGVSKFKYNSRDLKTMQDRYIKVCRDVCSSIPDLTEDDAKIAAEIYRTYDVFLSNEYGSLALFNRIVHAMVAGVERQRRPDHICILNILPSYIKSEKTRREAKA